MKPGADRRWGYVSRTRPTKGWETFGTVAGGVVVIAFSVVWTIVWFSSTEGVLALLGFVGLFFIYQGVKMIIDAARSEKAMGVLEDASTTIKATVLDRYIKEHSDEYGRKSYTYHIAVQFDAGGKRLTLAARVSKGVYNARERDQTLTVRYANADPRIVLIAGEAGFRE
jgi:hypothetical protein